MRGASPNTSQMGQTPSPHLTIEARSQPQCTPLEASKRVKWVLWQPSCEFPENGPGQGRSECPHDQERPRSQGIPVTSVFFSLPDTEHLGKPRQLHGGVLQLHRSRCGLADQPCRWLPVIMEGQTHPQGAHGFCRRQSNQGLDGNCQQTQTR